MKLLCLKCEHYHKAFIERTETMETKVKCLLNKDLFEDLSITDFTPDGNPRIVGCNRFSEDVNA
jgi:hypothetical protein